jgi:branched-subunit amino acid aminotransferase/4-amino-4-deoxychorismate lyase
MSGDSMSGGGASGAPASSGPASSGGAGGGAVPGRGEALLRWHGAAVGMRPAQEPGELMVIDSWLVEDGRMRAFEAHERRFGTSCGAVAGIGRERTREFLEAAIARVPPGGRWFPRAELVDVAGKPRLQFRVRPAPPRGDSVRLWLSPSPDERSNPAVKGPDLAWLSAQREAAVAAGADEAVLLSADGDVLEGSTTSIVWWRGDTLCAPPEDGRLLPGTTRNLLLDAASAVGASVTFETATPDTLAGLEVWAVNALHGIRPVTAWLSPSAGPGAGTGAGTGIGTGIGAGAAGIAAGPATRAPRWQAYLEELSREIRPGAARARG